MPVFGFRRRGADTDRGPARSWAQSLEKVVSSLPDVSGVTDYVLTGRGAGVLATLPKAVSATHSTWFPMANGYEGAADLAALRSLYAGFADVDAAVLRRWGHVLDAAQGVHAGWGTTAAPLAGKHWHDLMIAQMVAATRGSGPLPAGFADLARIAALDGEAPADLAAALLTRSTRWGHSQRYGGEQLGRLPGLGDALVEHRTLVAAALRDGTVDARVAALDVVGSALTDAQLEAVVEPLVDAATATSTQVREHAQPVLARVGGPAASALRVAAVQGNPQARARALELLAERPSEVAWARETALADRASSVRAVVARWDAAAAAPVDEPADDELRLDPVPPVRWAVARPVAEAVNRRLVDELAVLVGSENAHSTALNRQGFGPQRLQPVPDERTYRDLVAVLVAGTPPRGKAVAKVAPWTASRALGRVVAEGLVDTVTTVKLLAALDLLDVRRTYSNGESVLAELHARTGQPDLRTLQRMLDELGMDGRAWVWRSFSSSWGQRLGRGWDAADVWPFVAEHLDWVLSAASGSGNGWDSDDLALFAALATLPSLPARLVDPLLAIALGSRKTQRRPAQDALASVPRIGSRAAAGLEDGRSETRLVAAQWLTRLADPATLPALQAAWAKERQDVVRGALLDALLALGERAETYLDPQALGRTAAKVLAKGMPAALAWCDWDTLPGITWASSGEPVPREVVQWLCVTAVKGRSPEPDAVLRQYAALFATEDRERLAHHLLTMWLDADVRPHPADVAEENARQTASNSHRWMTTDPEGPYHGMTVEQLTAALLPGCLRQPKGSEIASKGLLAVVAACGGRDVVAPADRYLREWFGQRAAQGKALIAMLAWVDHPAATQLVLAVGSRFRTKSFQEEATAQAHALAERKGWTVDELADRTIPTGGFDDDGLLELSYGPRTFVARLLPDLTVELRDAEGKPVKTLPAPRRSDDPELAKDAKKRLTAAKKDVKTVADLQQRRLYEALCTERAWSADDWQRYLCAHPVVGPAVRRLVWVATDGAEGETVVFRPLDDGSLTDADDEPVTLAAGARVRLAHDSLLTAAQVEAWTSHLADYEVTPLFQQLGRGLHAVGEHDRARRTLDDFEGHLLGSYALRGRATRLGYTRGAAGDGGWFVSYVKRFPTLGIVAEIEFTGSPLPEEDRTVALRSLTFSRERPGVPGAQQLTLGDVPAVLVSECWHDVRQMAAQGTGFDPEWQKKTEF